LYIKKVAVVIDEVKEHPIFFQMIMQLIYGGFEKANGDMIHDNE
jgi:hypothetical protein